MKKVIFLMYSASMKYYSSNKFAEVMNVHLSCFLFVLLDFLNLHFNFK